MFQGATQPLEDTRKLIVKSLKIKKRPTKNINVRLRDHGLIDGII